MRRPPLKGLILVVLALVVAWLVFWSVDYEYDRANTVSKDLRLIDRMHAYRSAFPVPRREDLVVSQTLMHGEEPLWTMQRAFFDVVMFASPDERYVAMQSAGHREPIRILEVARRLVGDIGTPESARRRNDYAYPLRFHAWSDDSRMLYLRTHEGRGYYPHPQTHWFREIYAVDPATGASKRLARCTSDKMVHETRGPFDWSRTPCADSARPPRPPF